MELVNKNIIFNKPKTQGLDSYCIVHAKENSELTDVTIANKNVNISPDINKSSSNENTPDKIHADNIEKDNTIQNSASANEKLGSGSSIISENPPPPLSDNINT